MTRINKECSIPWLIKPWASFQTRKICGLRMRRECRERFPPPPRVSDAGMYHDTCVTHVPWCMPGSLTCGFLWRRWRGKHSRHSRRTRKPQFCVSCKRPMRDSTSKVHTYDCLPIISLSLWTLAQGILKWSFFNESFENYISTSLKFAPRV